MWALLRLDLPAGYLPPIHPTLPAATHHWVLTLVSTLRGQWRADCDTVGLPTTPAPPTTCHTTPPYPWLIPFPAVTTQGDPIRATWDSYPYTFLLLDITCRPFSWGCGIFPTFTVVPGPHLPHPVPTQPGPGRARTKAGPGRRATCPITRLGGGWRGTS